MSPDLLFTICNYSVLPAWVLLIVAPRWKWTDRIVHSAALPLLLAVVYATTFIAKFGEGEGDFGSLAGVMALFTSPWGVLIGWIHYLAFDLFIGAWEARDARRIGLHHAALVPCLIFTLMLGPVGLLLYLSLRAARTRTVVLDETAAPERNPS